MAHQFNNLSKAAACPETNMDKERFIEERDKNSYIAHRHEQEI